VSDAVELTRAGEEETMPHRFHTEMYCPHLKDLSRERAIRAIHGAWLQLRAITRDTDCGDYDNAPAITALEECLREAGFAGVEPGGER